ncbi:MAG: ABC transporter permease [Acidimicrobiales bacterium]|nr:ABC transporter permease [Acidimicrobiales bacterium]
MSAAPATTAPVVRARPGGFRRDLLAVATRALLLTSRDLEAVIPALVIPVFFFAVNVGALENFVQANAGIDYKAFQLPVAIIFAVTGVTRASSLVIDIRDGYFDRMLMTPMHRRAMLLGLMAADFVLVIALSIPVVILGFVVGVRFDSGPVGVLVFVLVGALWGIAYAGIPYAIALKPEEALSGWLATIADLNPVTYLLAALRSLLTEGWEWDVLAQGLAAVVVVGAITQTLAFLALRSRVRS